MVSIRRQSYRRPVVFRSAPTLFRALAAGAPVAAILCLMGATAVASSAAAGPIARLSAYRLDFAAQAVGTTSDPQTVILTNAGDAPLTIADIAANSRDFTLTAGTGSGTVPPGASREIEVRYAPWNIGKRSALLTITSDAPNSPIAVGLFGAEDMQPGPRAYMSPAWSNMGFVRVGSTSGSWVNFGNEGTGPLMIKSVTLTGANAGDFQIEEGGSPGIVKPDTYRFIQVVFHPTADGPRSASLVIEDDAPGSPHRFLMFSTSSSVDPIRVTPASLDFGTQAEGSTSAAQTVTLTNTGANPVNILGIVLAGARNEQYALVGGNPGPIAPGESRTVSVHFAPRTGDADGLGDDARLFIAHDALRGDPLVIPLTGTQTTPKIQLSTGLIFDSQRVGTSSDPQGVTVTNTGHAPLAIVGLDLQGPNPGAYVVDSTACLGRILAPGTAGSFGVVFAPTRPGASNASLSIASNTFASPDRVTLSGNGIAPALRLSPVALDFGQEPVGLSGTLALLLQNTGNGPLSVGSIAIQGANAAEFALASGGGSSQTLQPGDISLLNVRFSPTATGSRSASLVIPSDAATPQLVPLTGFGTAPLLRLSSDSLIFNIQPAGGSSAAQTVVFTNNGDAPLNIDGLTLDGPNYSSFHILSDSGEKSLAPGASRTVQLSFSAATTASVRGPARIAGTAHIAAVSYSATLVVHDNDLHPGSLHQIKLTAAETAPAVAAPTGLTALAVSSTQMNLSWINHPSIEIAYEIYRKTAGGSYILINDVGPGASSFSDRYAVPGTTCTYRVRAVSPSLVSDYTNEASVTTSPAAPTGLTASAVSSTQVNLSWTNHPGNEVAYEIYRKPAGGGFILINDVGPGQSSFSDRYAAPGTAYTYRVRAVSLFLVSDYTNEANVTTAPAAPTGLTATAVSPTRVNLKWTPHPGNEIAYEIYRKVVGGSYLFINDVGPGASSFSDLYAIPGTANTYRVRAVSLTLVSDYTNEMTVTTPP